MSTSWRPRARRRSAAPARSISSKLSITISPTPHSSAIRSSDSDLALPCITIRSGAKPACSARCSSPAGGHVAPQPLLREQRPARPCRERPWRRTPRGSPRARSAGRHRTNARARARRSSSATTYAGVPILARELDRVAAADLQPPALVQAAAERECRTERVCEEVVPVAIAVIIAWRVRLGPAGRSRRGSRAQPRHAVLTRHQRQPHEPDRHQHDALQLRRRQPRQHLVVAADELDQQALQPAEHEIQREHHARAHAVAQLPQQYASRHIATVS